MSEFLEITIILPVVFRLRGLVHVGKLDTSVNDDVAERFRLDDDQCPIYLL